MKDKVKVASGLSDRSPNQDGRCVFLEEEGTSLVSFISSITVIRDHSTEVCKWYPWACGP